MAWCRLVPRSFKRRRKAWYILHAHALGDPRKMLGNQYTHHLSSMSLYIMQNPRMITMVMQSVTMEIPAHARAVCTSPFLLLLKGLGTRLGAHVNCLSWLLKNVQFKLIHLYGCFAIRVV